MARVKLEGLSIPKRVGIPAGGVVPQSIVPEIQEVNSSSEDDAIVKEVPVAERAKEHVEQSSSKKRKVSGSGVPPLTSFEEGDRLLKSYAKRAKEEVDLGQLSVQLVSSISKSLQCALAVGHGYRVSESSRSQFVADKEKAEKEIQVLKAEQDASQEELKTLSSDMRVTQAKVRDLEFRLEDRTAEIKRLEGLLENANAQVREVQQELDSMAGSQQVDAIFSSLCGRIGLLREPISSHDLHAELLKFKRIFPDDPTFDDLIKEANVVIPEREQPEVEPTGEEAGASEGEGDGCRTPSAQN